MEFGLNTTITVVAFAAGIATGLLGMKYGRALLDAVRGVIRAVATTSRFVARYLMEIILGLWRHATRPRERRKRPSKDVSPGWPGTTPPEQVDPAYEDRRVEVDGECLKIARMEAGLKQSEVGEIFGHAQSWISKYEQGVTEMYRGDVRLLAELYGCDPRDLLTYTEDAQDLTTLPPPEPERVWVDGAKLRRCRHRLGLTQYEVEEATGISHPQISRYERNCSPPYRQETIRIARTLDCVVEEFVLDDRAIDDLRLQKHA